MLVESPTNAGMDAVFRPLSSLGTDGSQFAGFWLAAALPKWQNGSVLRGHGPLIGLFADCSPEPADARTSAPENPCPRCQPVAGAAGRLYGSDAR